jgi:hypothetical protein
MDATLLADQMTRAELRALAESAARNAAICRRQIAKTQDDISHSSMSPAQEEFWLGETRVRRLARLRRHAAACDHTARGARAALRFSPDEGSSTS